MRRTKIVCTLGPSSNTPDKVSALIAAGMDVARLNFSHGTHDEHRAMFTTVREAARRAGKHVAILMDLQGPKIRTGTLREGNAVTLETGAALTITTRSVEGDASLVSTTYADLPRDVRAGDRILVADGVIQLEVEDIADAEIRCRVIDGGVLGEHKGINLPGVAISSPSVTDKDMEDLEFGLGLGPDYVALSFVRSAGDLRVVRRRMEELGASAPLIAKVERPEAVADMQDILEETDGVMVARGDLGVEMDLWRVPQIQKELIHGCNRRGKPVITATQMLESMMREPRPTRAEVNDVANAIYDGSDAVMLSGETAAGPYPVEAARTMARIALETDEAVAAMAHSGAHDEVAPQYGDQPSFSDAIGHAVAHVCETLPIRHVICFSESGYTARAVLRHRPRKPVTVLTRTAAVANRCALYWGAASEVVEELRSTDELVQAVDGYVRRAGLAADGDRIVITAGTPLALGGRTNLLKLHQVGDAP
jgi:pyruvate kinase